MKITCPECSALFDVPVSLLGSGGRRVRCGNCGHIWLQDATPSEGSFGGFRSAQGYTGRDEDIEPIPASLHPLPHDADDDEEDDGPGFFATLFADVKWGALGRMLGGFAVGVGLLCALTYALASAHMVPGFLKPAAIAMGAVRASQVEGLIFQDVKAASAMRGEDGITTITGALYNNGMAAQLIPMIVAVPVSAEGEALAQGYRFKPEQDVIAPEELVVFSAEMTGTLPDGAQIRLDFMSE